MNFFTAIQSWFGVDLDEFGFMPVPLAFYPPDYLLALSDLKPKRGKYIKNFMDYLDNLTRNGSGKTINSSQKYFTTLELNVKFKKDSKDEALPVRISKDPTAPEVRLSEQDIRASFPWDYPSLVKELKWRIPNLKLNNDFHNLMKAVKQNLGNFHIRQLDPGNSKSATKCFFSHRAISDFEKLRRKSTLERFD